MGGDKTISHASSQLSSRTHISKTGSPDGVLSELLANESIASHRKIRENG